MPEKQMRKLPVGFVLLAVMAASTSPIVAEIAQYRKSRQLAQVPGEPRRMKDAFTSVPLMVVGYAGWPQYEPGNYPSGYPLRASIGLSTDGINFKNISPSPWVYTAANGVRDPAIISHLDRFYMVHGNGAGVPFNMHIAESVDAIRWTAKATLDLTLTKANIKGAISAAAFSWTRDPNGKLVVVFMRDPGGFPPLDHFAMWPLSSDPSTWNTVAGWSVPVRLKDLTNTPIDDSGNIGNVYVTSDETTCYSLYNRVNPSTSQYYFRTGPAIDSGWSSQSALSLPGINKLSGLTDGDGGDSAGIAKVNGVLYISISNGNSLTGEQWVWRSSNEGATWSGPNLITYSGFGGLFFNWFPIANNPGFSPAVVRRQTLAPLL